MNVGDILHFKPEFKRGAPDEDEEGAAAVPAAKVRRKLQEIERSRKDLPFDQLTDEEKLKMLQAAESEVIGGDGEVEQVVSVDIASMKKTILSFQKKVSRNQEARIKFPDNPEKFMQTELELHDEIVEMRAIATQPEIYPLLLATETGALKTIITLVNHDNTDMSVAVIELLHELSDVDTLNESTEGAQLLVDELSEFRVVSVLVQNMERLDEANQKEEAQAIFNSLGIVENILEFKPDLSFEVASNQGLLPWIIRRLKMKSGGDVAVKSYASEILAILLQNSDDVKRQLGESDGIDTLLQQLSQFKRRDPNSSEDAEFMENTFDCLCSALMCADPNRSQFLEGEGLQLMNLLLREKKRSRFGALKVLNYALSGTEGADNCLKWVDILGLRSIFPLFMRPPSITKGCGYTTEQCEEHILSIIYWLIRNIPAALNSSTDQPTAVQQRVRLMNKFTEKDFEKIDRLMELHFKYNLKVRGCDRKIDAQKRELMEIGEDIDDELEDEFYLERLDAGLFTLQLIDYIILEAANYNKKVAEKVHTSLRLRGQNKDTIRDVVREYASKLGDSKGEEEREEEQNRLLALVNSF
ncbi:beta-catenin-like protein 1 [Convolutriloba macropyga]|uniref:beta-catenin-like protein 1 n=1 Tax=Convolutriloba macropyga TaxID=536237 RepID=UPI003F527F1E